jgi:hypothetical protein
MKTTNERIDKILRQLSKIDKLFPPTNSSDITGFTPPRGCNGVLSQPMCPYWKLAHAGCRACKFYNKN